jgi:hypothetical protein
MVRQKELDETQKWHAPEEIALSGGHGVCAAPSSDG